MKKNILYLLALCCLSLYACSEDEETGTIPTYNSNGNSTSNIYNGVNDNGNWDNTYATRLEIPKLKDGADGNNIFLVHETSEYGVNYCIEWDCTLKAQRWTAFQMYNSNNVTNWDRNNWSTTEWKRDPFQPDPLLPTNVRTELDHYRGSGYNRGHICASADRLNSKDANEQTFYLSNTQPQIYAFNAGVWENMESQVRRWNKSSFRDTLYVVKGGTIDKAEHIIQTTNKGLLVPKYFFMAILCKNSDPSQWGYKALAFWVEHAANNDTDLRKYIISIDELEEKTGIDFFCNLPDEIENTVERNVAPTAWGFKN